MSDNELYLTGLTLACALATYLWRGLGVWIAGRINTESEVFKWITCVAYAMLAGLISRMVFFPIGLLAESALWQRCLSVVIGLAVYTLTRGNLLWGILAGSAVFPFLLKI
jgi:branched-subunit amino acid transport protein